MALPIWNPTKLVMPSVTYKGESTPDAVYTAVGKSLHVWEHAESALTRLFQVLCESKSRAACRAYGVIESPFTKGQVLRAAAETFFGVHSPYDADNDKHVKALIKAYEGGFQYRNNIAHGMTVGFHLKDGSHSGYFLCPPSYTTKKVKRHPTNQVYLLGASYIYSVSDLNHYSERFTQIRSEAVRLAHLLNDKYKIVPPGELLP